MEEVSAPPRQGVQSRRKFVKRVFAAGAAANVAGLALEAQVPGLVSTPILSPLPGAGSTGPITGLELSPLARRTRAYEIRVQAALAEYMRPLPSHSNNGDEALYPAKFANFTKGFPCNDLGVVELSAYQIYLHALATGNPADFARIPFGCPGAGSAYFLVNPQSGLAYDLEGIDAWATSTPPPPAFASAAMCAEVIELYWMALLRDVPFDAYATNALAQEAAADLSRLPAFAGPRDPATGQVTASTLFRDVLPGCLIGPWRSQFSYLPAPFDGNFIDLRIRHATPGVDYLTTYAEWLNVQTGCPPTATQQYESEPLYIRTGRDCATSVHNDIVYQDNYMAMLALVFPIAAPSESGGIGAPLNPGNPYLNSQNQGGFVTFGMGTISVLMVEAVTRALKASWFHKWFVHRRLRPEEYGGCIHNALTGAASYPIDVADLLSSPLFTANPSAGLIYSKYGSYLLPQAFAEGCPVHPSYPQGHSTAASACVTMLKAFFDETYVIPNPVVPSEDGTTLVPYTGADAGQMTVGGELNKLASNISQSRDFAGVHYRSDGLQGLLLGEAVAISILQDQAQTYNEKFPGFTFTKFDGTRITVGGNSPG